MISSIFGSLFGDPEDMRVSSTAESPWKGVSQYEAYAVGQQVKMQEYLHQQQQLQAEAHQGQMMVQEGDTVQRRLNQYGVDPHPALHSEIVEMLLKYADSLNPYIRRVAVKHRMMPEAKVIMMAGDEDRGVREIAAKIMQYNEENRT